MVHAEKGKSKGMVLLLSFNLQRVTKVSFVEQESQEGIGDQHWGDKGSPQAVR